ncbi:malonic semialdehyde reductase [Planktotalea sp.]|uniref:malonic semialdehyde reductase n=1 Tax=Planktotalea sp. TaxID=2029877 RepID=UPI0025E9AEF1|nr:malonic semialdehyde reductase [Planktotalea sp.]
MSETSALDKTRSDAQDDVIAVRQKLTALSADQIDLILTGARSHYAWQDRPVSDEQLTEIFDISKMGPTSMNTCPVRIVFVRSDEGKDKLAKSLKPANVPKVMSAPVTAIIAYDTGFWTELPKLFPHEDRRHFFEGKTQHIEDTAFRNSTLQGAYFMIAARAIGLDVGAISGFDNAVVDQEFFDGTTVKSNFLCNLGYADETALFQRLPRFEFDDVCKIV